MIVEVLGTMQDAGLPHIYCECSNCLKAAEMTGPKRLVSSLGIVDEVTKEIFIIDATPDYPRQVRMLGRGDSSRPVKPEGILLTHAHMGHYLGLAYLGKEAAAAEGQRIWCTRSMYGFLADNQPYADMLKGGIMRAEMVKPGDTFRLNERLSARAFGVPHRGEYSDTVGYVIDSSGGRVMYLPDIDRWEGFEERFSLLMQRVDVAFLDGTFFSPDELEETGNRSMKEVPHPSIEETLRLMEGGVLSRGSAQIYFIHFNHTNPLLDEDSPVRKILSARDVGMAREGQSFRL